LSKLFSDKKSLTSAKSIWVNKFRKTIWILSFTCFATSVDSWFHGLRISGGICRALLLVLTWLDYIRRVVRHCEGTDRDVLDVREL